MFTFSEYWSCFTQRHPMSRNSLRHQHAGDLRMKVILVWVWFVFPVGVLCVCVHLWLFYFVAKDLLNLWVASLHLTHGKTLSSVAGNTPVLHLQCQEQLQSPGKLQSCQLWLSLGAGCLCCAGLKLLLTALCVIIGCESASGPEESGNVQRNNLVKKQF